MKQPPLLPSLLSSVCVVSLAGLGRADEVTYVDEVAPALVPWTTPLGVPAFDPALGRLTAVRVVLTTSVEGAVGIENLSAAAGSGSVSFAAAVDLAVPDGGSATLSAAPAATIPVGFQAYDGATDYGGLSGGIVTGLTGAETVSGTYGAAPQWIGPGALTLTASAGNAISTSGTGITLLARGRVSAGAALEVTYEFTPFDDCDGDGTPDHLEPDCDGDGTPDDCEPDCDADGAPDGCEPDADGDGLPDDCDLVGLPLSSGNRSGSLVLWPEYDNRAGVATMLTITSTLRDATGGRIAVEFVYVDETDCTRFNRTELLTPADTLTLITNFHDPLQERGFVYAFAKDPVTGEPVAHDHLIGSQLALDGLEALGYSVPAVTFRALNEEGSPTDLDGDGIRDLDGVEYEPLPDRIAFPRFFGQDATGFQSELLLIGLTGGAAFDTVVDLLAFNDNEEIFSTQYVFHCWERVPLSDISSVFLEDFLKTVTDHDLAEVVGAPFLESGWLRVDGHVATSSLVMIPDPAVYALLVETLPGSRVAEIPFFDGVQTNGDLWSLDPQGDND